MTTETCLSILSLLALCGWGYLALFNGRFWQLVKDDQPADKSITWPSVSIIIPARNEAESLPHALPSLLTQDYCGEWKIFLVDDHSTDGTADLARTLAEQSGHADRLTVVQAPDLPEGWSGKVAAMQAGFQASQAQQETSFVLFTDADIAHASNSLSRLMTRSIADNLDLHSLMVKLHCASAAEKLLIPAFVFFFAMLYPFQRANNTHTKTAAAAGGVMLVRTKALANIGGLKRIKSALIDDCSLAAAIKHDGGDHSTAGHIRLSLTENVHSIRLYPFFGDIWRMVARTAFTQLHYSWTMLAGTVLGLGCLFLAPVVLSLVGSFPVTATSLVCWAVMTALYAPMVRFYGLPVVWTFTLPLAACLYLGATIDSARLYALGKGGQWKNRSQAIHDQ